MLRFVLFLVGFGFSVIGFIYIIAYLNYLSIGYDLIDYFKLITTKIECLIAFLGIFLINIAVFMKGDKNVLCI